MAIEHRNIPESGLHEPKGVSQAPSKRVYISDGNGSGNWVTVDADTLRGTISNSAPSGRRLVTDGSGGFSSELPSGTHRGVLTLTGNTTSVSVSAASNSNLRENSDYQILTLPFSADNLANMGGGSNYLEIQETGIYMVDMWGNARASNDNVSIGIKFVVNDTDFVARRPRIRMSTQDIFYNFSANGFHPFEAGDQIKLSIASTVSTNVTIDDLAFQMILVGDL